MSSLKDALLKAGFKNKKAENERTIPKKKEVVQKSVKHQINRNFCEVCEQIHPDVEQFKHRNRSIDAEWICVNCADVNQIHDDYRTSAQSDFSKQAKYLRRYGPTKLFEDGRPTDKYKNFKNKPPQRQGQGQSGNYRSGNVNGNRADGNTRSKDSNYKKNPNKNFNR